VLCIVSVGGGKLRLDEAVYKCVVLCCLVLGCIVLCCVVLC